MKSAKKLAALFLAMVMALSLTAMTAAAYGAEEHVHDETCCEATVQPRKLNVWCSRCGSSASAWTITKEIDGKMRTVHCFECSGCGYWEQVV